MTEHTLPPMPDARLHAHELIENKLRNDWKHEGVWLGCADLDVLQQAHTPGETGDEILHLYTADQMRAYALAALSAPAEGETIPRYPTDEQIDAGWPYLARPAAAPVQPSEDKWRRDELWHSLAKAHNTNAYLVREIVLGYLESLSTPLQDAPPIGPRPVFNHRDADIPFTLYLHQRIPDASRSRIEAMLMREFGPIAPDSGCPACVTCGQPLPQGKETP